MPDDEAIGYADAAQVYFEKGWRGVLPLNRGTKWPPPKGFTGYDGADPSFADILQWSELYPQGNLCLRLPEGIIGIDVDAYGAKTGAAAFSEAVRRWGPLPEGPQSSSRNEDLVSGLRLFRVPAGTLLETVIVFPELSIGDIEVIQRHHRYVVCWPSVHPEGRDYWWRNSKGQLLGIPELSDIPALPQRWIDGLKLTPRSLDLSAEFDTRQALTTGEPSPTVQARLAMAIKELNLPGMSRHDTCCRHVLAILRHGAEGQPGVEQALSLLREVFIAVLADPSRGEVRPRDIAFSEFNRMITNSNVARELSQPGILDWFRAVMDGAATDGPPEGGDPGTQFANASRADGTEAAAPSGDTQAEPPDPSSGGELEVLEQDFWTARRQHQVIFETALAKMTAPWAVFACCVARALALVPPSITLPPIIGGRGSLNWFCAIVGKSGGGKGAAGYVAESLVPDYVNERSIGSGEGMIECYNRTPGKGDNPPPPVVSVMFMLTEIDTLGAMNSRSGQTTMTVLRSGFSGEKLGHSYRGRQNETVASHTYRMTLVAMVQPSRAGALLDDSGGGTPQRFMWFPGMDRRITEERLQPPVDNLGNPLTLSPSFPADWEIANAVGSVLIPAEAEAEIRRTRAEFMRGEGDSMKGHALFAQEKLAFALAFIDGRTAVDEEDWRLAGIAAKVSDWTRYRVMESYRESKIDESRDRGQLKGVEAAAAERGKVQEQVDSASRVLNNVIDKIKKSMPDGISNRELSRSIVSRDRSMVKGALDYAQSQGWITQVEGTTTWVTP